MHSFHLTCLFTRDRWKRCSTYAGTVSGAVPSATKYTKSSKEDPGAWLPWLPFCLCPAVDLATCSSSCNSPCPLVADGCGRGAVDVALTSVAWSVAVATDHATAVSSRGGATASSLSGNDRIGRRHNRLAPQSVSSADLSTLGPVTAVPLRPRVNDHPYDRELYSGYNSFRVRVDRI